MKISKFSFRFQKIFIEAMSKQPVEKLLILLKLLYFSKYSSSKDRKKSIIKTIELPALCLQSLRFYSTLQIFTYVSVHLLYNVSQSLQLLNFTALNSFLLLFTLLKYINLYFTTLYFTLLYFSILKYILLNFTTLYYTLVHFTRTFLYFIFNQINQCIISI